LFWSVEFSSVADRNVKVCSGGRIARHFIPYDRNRHFNMRRKLGMSSTASISIKIAIWRLVIACPYIAMQCFGLLLERHRLVGNFLSW